MAGARHEAVATAGINHLGGDDFDEALAELALSSAKIDLAPAERARFLERCREAKEALNANSRRVVVEADGRELTVSVAEYYDRCAPLVAQSIDAMTPVMAALDREDGGPEAGLAGIYVVGGGSALPIVGRVLKDRFGRRVHRSPYPFAATAIGLAIAADDEAHFELADKLSRNFGVFREAEAGARVAFDPIFTKDTPVPIVGATAEPLTRVYRAAHNVGHFRFVECAAFDATGTPRGDITPFGDVLFPFDPTLRGRKDLRAVPIHRTVEGAGPMIEERYWVDESGIVQVKITDLADGYAESHRLGG
jgi:molecular chaperone DnaK (HSP70)